MQKREMNLTDGTKGMGSLGVSAKNAFANFWLIPLFLTRPISKLSVKKETERVTSKREDALWTLAS